MTGDDPRLAKIRALLAKAEATTFPEEAKTFTAKAQELMTKWAVDDAMLAGSRLASSSVETVTIRVGNPPYQGPKQSLLAVIANSMDCKIILEQVNKRWNDDGTRRAKADRFTQAYIVGFRQDLEFVQMLFTSCLLQADLEFLSDPVQKTMFAETSHPGHRVRWRNAFMMGYVGAIGSRLAEAKRATVRQAEDATPGVGLVLASKKDQVATKVNELFPSLRKGGGSSAGEGGGSGWGLGLQAGRRADLSRDNNLGGTKGQLHQ